MSCSVPPVSRRLLGSLSFPLGAGGQLCGGSCSLGLRHKFSSHKLALGPRQSGPQFCCLWNSWLLWCLVRWTVAKILSLYEPSHELFEE